MKNTAFLPSENKKPATGFWVKLLIAGLLVTALQGFVRLQQSVQDWNWLQSLGLYPGSFYLAVTGFLAGIISLAAGLALMFKQRWAFGYTRAAVAVLVLGSWLDRLLFTQSEDAWSNLIFRILVSLAVLGYTFVALRKKPAAGD